MSTVQDRLGRAEAPLSETRRSRLSALQRDELVLAFVLTITTQAFPRWYPLQQLWAENAFGLRAMSWGWYVTILFLILGLLLTLPSRRRSGLVLGAIGQHWGKVLLVYAIVLGATALVYPRLPVRPWGDQSIAMWTLSPVAQNLLFFGYLYGRLGVAFPGQVHPRVPIDPALALTVCFFAFWHVPNFYTLPPGYVVFQLFYTSVLAIIPGLTRQWTGSIIYLTLLHASVNFIAWSAS